MPGQRWSQHHRCTNARRRFATDYTNECSLSVGQLLAQRELSAQGPLLFEPFLQDGPSSLYPLPVKVANKLEAPGTAADLDSVRGGSAGWRAPLPPLVLHCTPAH